MTNTTQTHCEDCETKIRTRKVAGATWSQCDCEMIWRNEAGASVARLDDGNRNWGLEISSVSQGTFDSCKEAMEAAAE